ncbi:hypothetical protein [Chryseobacterium luteum]|nr:hypothetical protein [Chryseobacterium luteum]
MKKNTNVPNPYTAYLYAEDPSLTETFKWNNTDLTEMEPGTFIF